jgi:protein subunit release factor B
MSHVHLHISAGVGPAEAQRFAFLLARYVEQMCITHGLEVIDVVFRGAEGAARSVTLHLRGELPSAIADLVGSHALVQRLRGPAARKRWFAAVSLEYGASLPAGNVRIAREDLEISACRAGGPGGQHVNKVATAVRVRHLPSGLTVRASSERSQKTNLNTAIERLEQLLQQQHEHKASASQKITRLSHYRVERGNPVCTYTVNNIGELCLREAQ